MRRSIALAALLVLAACVVLGCSAEPADETSLNRVLEPQQGDDEVVAVVQGRDAMRGDVREAAEFWMQADDAMTSDEATGRAIVLVIDRTISQAEVERRKLTPTLAEAEDYMRPHREICLGEHGAECREALQSLGFDVYDESYWVDIALPEIREGPGGNPALSRRYPGEKAWETPTNTQSWRPDERCPGNCVKKPLLSGGTKSWSRLTWTRWRLNRRPRPFQPTGSRRPGCKKAG